MLKRDPSTAPRKDPRLVLWERGMVVALAARRLQRPVSSLEASARRLERPLRWGRPWRRVPARLAGEAPFSVLRAVRALERPEN
jgi:hypothetical protein